MTLSRISSDGCIHPSPAFLCPDTHEATCNHSNQLTLYESLKCSMPEKNLILYRADMYAGTWQQLIVKELF